MKTKQFLVLIAFMPLFLSCEKDTDYRDGFEGTYTSDVIGYIFFTDLGVTIPAKSEQLAITVGKSSDRMLTLNLDGELMSVTVEEDGNLQIPSESGIMPMQTEDGTIINMNVTISCTGTITDRMLTFKQSFSGNATITDKEGTYESAVDGTLIYSGTK